MTSAGRRPAGLVRDRMVKIAAHSRPAAAPERTGSVPDLDRVLQRARSSGTGGQPLEIQVWDFALCAGPGRLLRAAGQQGDAPVLGGQQLIGAGVPGTSSVHTGHQAQGGEHVMNRFCHHRVRQGRRGGGHVRDQVHALGRAAAGLGEVDLVPVPDLAAFLAKSMIVSQVRFQERRRASRRRQYPARVRATAR